MGLVSLGLWEVRNFRSFPSPLAAPLQAHTSCRSRLSLSPNPGPCHSLDSTRVSCSPCVCQGSKGEILCWTRVSFISPRACGKVPRVQVGKSIGYLIFQDVAYLLRIPSLFSNWVLNRKKSFLYMNSLKFSTSGCSAKTRLRIIHSFVRGVETR